MFGSLIGTFAFVLGGISITLAIGWSDMCAFMDIVTQDFSKYLGPQAGLGLNACFNNTPLMEAFNMTKQVSERSERASFEEDSSGSYRRQKSTTELISFGSIAARLCSAA